MILTPEDLAAIEQLIDYKIDTKLDAKIDQKLDKRFNALYLFLITNFVTKEEFLPVREDVAQLKVQVQELQSDMVDVKTTVSRLEGIILPEVAKHGQEIELLKVHTGLI